MSDWGGGMSADCTMSACLYVNRSVKHYFLLDQGDFAVQFMDMTEDEMKRPMEGKGAGHLSYYHYSRAAEIKD